MLIKIGDTEVKRDGNDVYLIAEAGVNHEGNINTAIEMIKQAAEAGADAIKFQTYKAERLASKYSPAYWDTTKETAKSQYELFKRYDSFEKHDYALLADACRKQGIHFLSTPFDEQAAQNLEELMPAFKIASADLTNFPLLKQIAHYNKPILLSTGAATMAEIDEAVRTIEAEGNSQIALLHCVLAYPTEHEDAHLGMIRHLRSAFPNYVIGYSDHMPPDPTMMGITTASFLGATIIEKHFTLNKTLKGNDHYHAMDAQDIKVFRRNMDIYSKVVGSSNIKQPINVEQSAIQYARRSVVATCYIPKGTKITEDMLALKRPGTGIPPKHLELVIGRRAQKNIQEDEVFQWEMI